MFRLKSIVPRKLFNLANLDGEISEQLGEHLDEIRSEFEKTVATWERPVNFQVVVQKYGGKVFTYSKFYAWVDEGTAPHSIDARRSPVLSFQVASRPKTKVGVIYSYQGGGGGPWVRTEHVDHPGIQARVFSETLELRTRGKLERRLERAIRNAVAKS